MRWAFAAALVALSALGAAPAALAVQTHDPALTAYLRRALSISGEVRYTAARIDLNGDGRPEVVVYLTSSDFCGSGGCTTLVLKPEDRSWRMVMNASVSRAPIRVLATRSHGWRDLGVMVAGGGIQGPYEARMRFDGRQYPDNPTVPPAIRLRHESGRIVIKADDGP